MKKSAKSVRVYVVGHMKPIFLPVYTEHIHNPSRLFILEKLNLCGRILRRRHTSQVQ